jgi:hypothetical protein
MSDDSLLDQLERMEQTYIADGNLHYAGIAYDARAEIERLRAKVDINDKHEQRRVTEVRALQERLETGRTVVVNLLSRVAMFDTEVRPEAVKWLRALEGQEEEEKL